MIEQEVLVLAVEADRLLVEAERRSSCQTCSAKSGCGTSVLAKWFNQKILQFYVDRAADAPEQIAVGDTVRVGMAESALTRGALSVYLLPLLVMIASALLADNWLADSNHWRDLLIAAAAFSGLGLSLLLTHLYFHLYRCQQNLHPVLLAAAPKKSL